MIPPRFTKPLCADVDAELWFSDDYNHQMQAKKICITCEHTLACRDYAMRVGVYGIWGASTDKERDTYRRARNLKPQPLNMSTFTDQNAKPKGIRVA